MPENNDNNYQLIISKDDMPHFKNILLSSLNSCTYLSKRGKRIAQKILKDEFNIDVNISSTGGHR